MNCKLLVITLALMSGFVGSAFAQMITNQEFTQEEIDKMKNTGVQLTTTAGPILIEFFPEDAPNTVHNFLGLRNLFLTIRELAAFTIQAELL